MSQCPRNLNSLDASGEGAILYVVFVCGSVANAPLSFMALRSLDFSSGTVELHPANPCLGWPNCDRIRRANQRSSKILFRRRVEFVKLLWIRMESGMKLGTLSCFKSEVPWKLLDRRQKQLVEMFWPQFLDFIYVPLPAASHFVFHGGLDSRQLAAHTCAAGIHGVETCRLGRRAVSTSHAPDHGRTPVWQRARLWAALQGWRSAEPMNLLATGYLFWRFFQACRRCGGAILPSLDAHTLRLKSFNLPSLSGGWMLNF